MLVEMLKSQRIDLIRGRRCYREGCLDFNGYSRMLKKDKERQKRIERYKYRASKRQELFVKEIDRGIRRSVDD